MKIIRTLIIFSLTSFMIISQETYSQGFGKKRDGNGFGKGRGNQYGRLFNINTIETITGVVKEIKMITSNFRGGMFGIHLTVKTQKESILVHLGPEWYLQKNNLKIEKGNKITITGSRVIFKELPTIIASQIKKGDVAISLRDSNGSPLWRGGHRWR
jgi:hypothetical protein